MGVDSLLQLTIMNKNPLPKFQAGSGLKRFFNKCSQAPPIRLSRIDFRIGFLFIRRHNPIKISNASAFSFGREINVIGKKAIHRPIGYFKHPVTGLSDVPPLVIFKWAHSPFTKLRARTIASAASSLFILVSLFL